MTKSTAVTILTGLLALLGAAGIALPIAATTDPDALDLPEIVDAAAVIGAALGSFLAAWHTWRRNTVVPDPPGEVVPPAQLATLRSKAAAHDQILHRMNDPKVPYGQRPPHLDPRPGLLGPNEVLPQAPPEAVGPGPDPEGQALLRRSLRSQEGPGTHVAAVVPGVPQ